MDGAGLLWGVRFAEPGDGRNAAHVAADVRDFALRAGLIVRHDGPDDGMVRLEPPLTVAAEVVDVAASILRFAIEAAHVMCGDRRRLTGRSVRTE